MALLFWIGVAWLGYVYAGYPFILAVLALVRRVRPVMRDDAWSTVSVLIAAHNEERDIGWKVEETLRWDYPSDRLEVLVASDASEDRTDEIVQRIKDPRLTFVRMEKRGGKNRALNRLVQRAQGEVLFFTDANAHIGADCLRRLVRHFADARVGCVTGDTHFWHDDGAVVSKGAGVYSGYESTLRHLESEIGSVLACDGAIFCIRRSLFVPLYPELANDLELPLRVGHAGYWTRHEPGAKVLEKDTRSPWESFRQRRRISGQGMLAMWKLRRVFSRLSGWQFLSRKLLRWLTLVPLALVTASALALSGKPVYAAISVLLVAFYGLALVGLVLALSDRSAGRLVCVPFYVLLGSLSTFAGVVDACLGRRFAVWEIPKLSRGRDHQAA
jgi:cellulose synthase/poly-beta-1,6-N-acetylglucosamine synthase-like glycosyltransferase